MKYLILITTFASAIIDFSIRFNNDRHAAAPPQPEPVHETAEYTGYADEWGKIPILEYHSISETESRWTRSRENFKKDLLWLYNNDYVLLSIEDYANSHYSIPGGKKPVILTFDDGSLNQFRYLENGDVDPDCAIGILDDFRKSYPDFGSAAVFYLNSDPFRQSEYTEKKLHYLWVTGRQIGYHTLDHTILRDLTAEQALNILQKQKEALTPMLPAGFEITTLAYPHGSSFTCDTEKLKNTIKVALLVGADPAYPLYHPNAKPYYTPRIQAINSEWLRHFGRNPGETEKDEGTEKFKVFISNGDPDNRTPESY